MLRIIDFFQYKGMRESAVVCACGGIPKEYFEIIIEESGGVTEAINIIEELKSGQIAQIFICGSSGLKLSEMNRLIDVIDEGFEGDSWKAEYIYWLLRDRTDLDRMHIDKFIFILSTINPEVSAEIAYRIARNSKANLGSDNIDTLIFIVGESKNKMWAKFFLKDVKFLDKHQRKKLKSI